MHSQRLDICRYSVIDLKLTANAYSQNSSEMVGQNTVSDVFYLETEHRDGLQESGTKLQR